MKSRFVVSVLVLALATGFAYAKSEELVGASAENKKNDTVSAYEHAKHCSKRMEDVSGHEAPKTLKGHERHDSTGSKELHKVM